MQTDKTDAETAATEKVKDESAGETADAVPREVNGPKGPEPTRYGDWDQKGIHNLKYFTWVEQQGKTYEEIQAQWYQPDYWSGIHAQIDDIDSLIEQFNDKVGLL